MTIKQISEIEKIGDDTEQKLLSVGIKNTNDLKKMHWRELARISHIGTDKLVMLYKQVGINLDYDEVAKFNQELQKEKITKTKKPKQKRYNIRFNKNVQDYNDLNNEQMAIMQFLKDYGFVTNPIQPNEAPERQGIDYYTLNVYGYDINKYPYADPRLFAIGTEEDVEEAIKHFSKQNISEFGSQLLLYYADIDSEKEKIKDEAGYSDNKMNEEELNEFTLSYMNEMIEDFKKKKDNQSIIELINFNDFATDSLNYIDRGKIFNPYNGREYNIEYEGDDFYIYIIE